MTRATRMKVLWFSPVPLPAVCEELGLAPHYGGWWIYSLLRELSGRDELELAVAWSHSDFRTRTHFVKDGITYFMVPDSGWLIRRGGLWRKASNLLEPVVGSVRDRRALQDAAAVVEEFAPDLVHVFGAEHRNALVAPMVRVPTVIWIQGVLDVYRHHYFGSMRCLDRLRVPRLIWDYYRMTVDAARERTIYRTCRFFIGRTDWDAMHQARLQPSGHYYQVQECMRPEFYSVAAWCPEEAERHTLFTTTSGSLLKGTDVLIRALALLQSSYPNIRLRVAGALDGANPVARRLFRLVRDLHLSECVEFLGLLDAARIARELERARVFVLPSYIENSPNSLAEAQLVGTPVVAAFAGGVPSMVSDGDSGLLFRVGDSTHLARQIRRVLADDALAIRLSAQARRTALERHSPGAAACALLRAYGDILGSGE